MYDIQALFNNAVIIRKTLVLCILLQEEKVS